MRVYRSNSMDKCETATAPSVLQSTEEYEPFEFDWRTNASFTDVAVDLRRSVQMIAEKTGKQVHVIGHSFGGVLTRSMVQLTHNSKEFSEKYIASITTVGSPHSGVFDSLTTRDSVFNAKIDNIERSFTLGSQSISFRRGQDGYAGSLIDVCRAITCYQAGDNVSFLNNDSAHNKYGVLNESGSVVYRLASTLSEYPEVPTQVLIGLVSDDQAVVLDEAGVAGEPGRGRLTFTFTPRLGSVSGDDLISDNGQRVTPIQSGSFGVYQGGDESKNNIEEHVLHFKLVNDENDFERDAYDFLLTVFDYSFEEGYSTDYTSVSTYYSHTIIKNPSSGFVYLKENESLSFTDNNLANRYVMGINHRTGQYSEAGNSIYRLARLSEVGLQDCSTSEDCFNPTWLYFKTFSEANPAEAINLPEKITLSGNVQYLGLGPIAESRRLQGRLTSEFTFPVTIEAYTGDVFSLLGLNERTTLNTDGTYEFDVPYEPDTKYSVIAYPEGDTLARVGAYVRASASKFLTTFSTLEESTLHFPTITLTDGNYEEGDLTIEVRDGTFATVLNGFNVLVLNSSQTTVDDIDGVDTGYISTQPKGDYTVKVSKDGYNDGEAECTVLPDEIINCVVNITSESDTSVDLQNGLVAYYEFDDNLIDSTSNNNVGEKTTNVNFSDGKHGRAVSFGGVSLPGHIKINNSSNLQFSDGATYSGWIKIDQMIAMDGWGRTTTSYGGGTFFAKSHDRSGAGFKYHLNDQNEVNAYTSTFDSWRDGWGDANYVFSSGLNDWVYVTYTLSSTAGTKIYFNGELWRVSSNPVDFTQMNDRDLYLGKFSDSWYPLAGMIDDFSIYNRILSQQEVLDLFEVEGQPIQ